MVFRVSFASGFTLVWRTKDMEEFPVKIKNLRELLGFTFEDFFKKIHLFSVCLFVISLIEISLLFLINPRLLKIVPAEFLETNPSSLLIIGILVLFFSVWKFLAIVIVKERIGKIGMGNCLAKSLSASLRIFIPIILIGGISAGFLILVPKVITFLITLLVYFWVLFSSYISLTEKRGGFEAFIRGFHVLQRNIFRVYWKISIFFIILLLAFFVLGVFFALFYFQILPLPAILNLIAGIILALAIYFLFLILAYSYLAVLFENAWKIRKYIAFYSLNPLLIMAIYVFLAVILATLIVGIGVFI